MSLRFFEKGVHLELSNAIDTVKSYLHMLPSLGAKSDEAVALVILAAEAYEGASWEYEHEEEDAAGARFWVAGFPGVNPDSELRQRRRQVNGDYEYAPAGTWARPVSNPHIPALPTPHEDWS